jgi:hypothetical protein
VVSRVTLKLKFKRGNCLPGRYGVGRLQDVNLRENFQGHLNVRLKSLNLGDVEDG